MLDQKSNKRIIANKGLPAIPDKLYFSIGEVGQLCDLKAHVLRYWEQEFSQLNPLKRRGNRRYYQRKDVLIIREIRSLLYEQGFTIEGARAKLNNENSNNQLKTNSHLIQETINYLELILRDLGN